MMEDQEWKPPPPPEDDSIFSAGTRDYYAGEVKKGAMKALAFGLLSIFCCPPIFAYFAYSTAQDVLTNIEVYEVEEGSRYMAQAAKILAVTGVVFWVIGLIFRFGFGY